MNENFVQQGITYRCFPKRRLLICSVIAIVLYPLPILYICIYWSGEPLWRFAVFWLMYSCAFPISGASGVVLFESTKPARMKCLSILFSIMMIYSLVNAVLFFLLFSILISVSSGSWYEKNTGLGYDFYLLYIVYFAGATYLAWRGRKASRIIMGSLISSSQNMNQNTQVVYNVETGEPLYVAMTIPRQMEQVSSPQYYYPVIQNSQFLAGNINNGANASNL